MVSLRAWSGGRVALVALGWVLLVVAATAVRVWAGLRAYERRHGPGDAYFVGVGLPGGWLLLLAPPVLLVCAWAWARRSRPAS